MLSAFTKNLVEQVWYQEDERGRERERERREEGRAYARGDRGREVLPIFATKPDLRNLDVWIKISEQFAYSAILLKLDIGTLSSKIYSPGVNKR